MTKNQKRTKFNQWKEITRNKDLSYFNNWRYPITFGPFNKTYI